MRTIRIAIALVAVTAALGVAAQAAAKAEQPKDFNAITKVTHTSTQGNRATFRETLKVKGKKAGRAKIRLLFGKTTSGTGRWTFDEGRLKGRGVIQQGVLVLRITDGTGLYKGAKGEVRIEQVTERRNRESFDFR
jgi:hypothetical protein